MTTRDDHDGDYIIRRIPKEYSMLLAKRGVAGNELLFREDRFNVTNDIVKITIDGYGMTQRSIGIQKQLRTLHMISKNPLAKNYVLGISSYPTDQRAKQLASWLMYLGCKQHAIKHRPGRGLPLWHRVFGSYKDSLRDDVQLETPGLLVITNVNEESTPVKMEKVRDLLEKYHNIPRIVVCGGMNAASLFANRLHYPLDGAVHIGPPNRVHE